MTGRGLDPERWQRLTALFDRAVELDITARRDLVERECRDDPDLRAELERLLAADADSGLLDTLGAAHARAYIAGALHAADSGAELFGQRIGAYRIERLLGRGGMGRVFLAVRDDGEFEQRVALKLLRPELIDDLARRRFLEERSVLARLLHPHIARLYDGGLGPNGQPWYAMEYVDGAPVTAWCDARRLGVAARLDLFRKVCDAVDYAHRHLVIHRDIKPGNILVDAEGNPKLLDFGIAKLLAQRDAATRSDTRLMTPEYAAPEQLRNEPVSTATDTYALGAVLFELLTGLRPFPDPLGSREPPSLVRALRQAQDGTGAQQAADIQARAAARAATPKGLRKSLRGDLERVLRAALDPEPARRYRSPSALAEDLRLHLRGRPVSLRRDRAYRLGKFLRRHRLGVALGSLAMLGLIAALALAMWETYQARLEAHNATAVKDFMVGVFAGADPTRHPGHLPDARELLDAGAQRLTTQFHGEPRIAAALMRALAASYAGIGAYDRARPLAERALALIIANESADSPAVLDARINDAEILRGASAYREAREQARIVLAQTHDATGPISIRAHLLLAAATMELGDYASARADAQRALVLAQAIGAIDMQAQAWDQLAQSDLGRGDYESAQRALRQSVALYARSRGAAATQTLDERDNLVFVLLHSGHADAAIDLYAQQIAELRRLLGPEHPRVVQTLIYDAHALWGAGRYAQTREVTQQAAQALQAAAAMPATLRNMNLEELAILARERGDLAGALRILAQIEPALAAGGADTQRYLQEARLLHVAIDAERGDPGALSRLIELQSHGTRMLTWAGRMDRPQALLAQGQAQQALDAYRQLEASLADPRRRAERLPGVLLGQGIALAELGRYDEARKLLDAAIATADQPANTIQTVGARLWRGWSWVRAGRAYAGLSDIEAALAWRRAQLGEDSYRTAEARLAHAEALALLGRRAEALAEQARARDGLAMLDPAHVLRRRAESPLPR